MKFHKSVDKEEGVQRIGQRLVAGMAIRIIGNRSRLWRRSVDHHDRWSS
ncbi:MAG: hypothetical protein PVH37_05740 [Desulfobacterales bacterium]